MDLKKIVGKLKGTFQGSHLNIGRGKTPDEVELESYQKRDYHDNIKKMVQKYRQKDTEDLFGGNSFENKNTILNPSGKKTKSGKILNSKNGFWK